MILRKSLIILMVLTVAAALGAAPDALWQQVPARDHARPNPFIGQPEAVAAGAIVYREHCQQCHRQNAQGDGHKRPALRSERLRAATDGALEWFLRQGDLRRGMPSWSSLPQQQRWQLVAYLRSLQ